MTPPDDGLNAFRGIVAGVLLSLPLWAGCLTAGVYAYRATQPAALPRLAFECDRTPDLVRAMTASRLPRPLVTKHVIDCGVEYREAWRELYAPLGWMK